MYSDSMVSPLRLLFISTWLSSLREEEEKEEEKRKEEEERRYRFKLLGRRAERQWLESWLPLLVVLKEVTP